MNKFKAPAADEAIKGESESEGEADHVDMQVEEAPAERRGGKAARMDTKQVAASGKEDGVEPFKNKQRVLIIASRGIVHRFRHLMMDIAKLLPHGSKDAKMESKDRPMVINEICEMKGCNNAMYFETRKHKDLYMWVAKTPLGPSAKFLIQNIHTMGELKFTGNHLMGSRPFLVFDAAFDSEPHLQLIKEMLSHAFGTPKGHRRSKPFVDHTMSFFFLDGRIWVRNYQITKKEGSTEPVLVEVGPRFCMQLHRIFAGAFREFRRPLCRTLVHRHMTPSHAKRETPCDMFEQHAEPKKDRGRHGGLGYSAFLTQISVYCMN